LGPVLLGTATPEQRQAVTNIDNWTLDTIRTDAPTVLPRTPGLVGWNVERFHPLSL